MASGTPVVDRAIQILMRSPDRPALEILDEAFSDWRSCDLEFDSSVPGLPRRHHPIWDQETDPPAPFAELLRRAFAPSLDPRDLALLSVWHHQEDPQLADLVHTVREAWQTQVIEPFARRYDLWHAGEAEF